MNNKVTFAAAGNGKTYSLCSQAKSAVEKNGNKCVLLISYTNEGLHSLENEYKKQNNGILDNKVIFKSWYSFLLSEFIKPYQCSLKLKEKKYKKDEPFLFPENYIKSIAFYNTNTPKWYNQNHVQYYINQNCDIIPNQVSHLAYLCNKHSIGKPINRMESIYSNIFIDEIQDYAGWDLEILRILFESKILLTCVGDYKQVTYRTNNSNKNKQYRDDNIIQYFKNLENEKLCTISYENYTRRFNNEICAFVNTIYNDTDSMIKPNNCIEKSNCIENTGVYIIDCKYISKYCEYYNPTILRYSKKTKINFYHNCDILNYGNSKGATYDRVVIIPVSTVLPFLESQKKITKNQTRAKFYVACTRAKYSIVFALDCPKENTFFKSTTIYVNGEKIPVYKFT